ncbi:MAG: FecR domain-containing protein [Elusimicrobiota bacterium]|nr:FecR domain-containing protein [Elusimicrobiota bacterium]
MMKTITVITGLCLIMLCLPCQIFSEGTYIACIYKLSGKVEIYSSVDGKWKKAYQYAPVNEKDKIRTYRSAYCDIVMQDGSAIRLNENTEIDIKSLQLINKKQKYKFDIKSGKILGLLGKRTTKDSSMKVYTPTAVIAVRGTDFALNVTSNITNVGLFEGELSLTTRAEGMREEEEVEVMPEDEVILTQGREAVIEKDRKPKVEERLSKFMEKEKQRWLKVKEYIEGVRKKLQERETYLQDCIKRQEERLKKLETEQEERLKKLEERRQEQLKKSEEPKEKSE